MAIRTKPREIDFHQTPFTGGGNRQPGEPEYDGGIRPARCAICGGLREDPRHRNISYGSRATATHRFMEEK